jgi:hypothetical protein
MKHQTVKICEGVNHAFLNSTQDQVQFPAALGPAFSSQQPNFDKPPKVSSQSQNILLTEVPDM